MALIIEIISSDIGISGQSEFTVDAAVDEVAVVGPAPGGLVFINGAGSGYFEAGDNVILTGALTNIPYGFGQGTGTAKLDISWVDGLNAFIAIPELGGNTLQLPNICGMLEFPPGGLFLEAPKSFGPVALVLRGIELNVSQINVPAQLDAQVIKVQFHLRVNHTKPLSTLP